MPNTSQGVDVNNQQYRLWLRLIMSDFKPNWRTYWENVKSANFDEIKLSISTAGTSISCLFKLPAEWLEVKQSLKVWGNESNSNTCDFDKIIFEYLKTNVNNDFKIAHHPSVLTIINKYKLIFVPMCDFERWDVLQFAKQYSVYFENFIFLDGLDITSTDFTMPNPKPPCEYLSRSKRLNFIKNKSRIHIKMFWKWSWSILFYYTSRNRYWGCWFLAFRLGFDTISAVSAGGYSSTRF
jgi:hypothetical protein